MRGSKDNVYMPSEPEIRYVAGRRGVECPGASRNGITAPE